MLEYRKDPPKEPGDVRLTKAGKAILRAADRLPATVAGSRRQGVAQALGQCLAAKMESTDFDDVIRVAEPILEYIEHVEEDHGLYMANAFKQGVYFETNVNEGNNWRDALVGAGLAEHVNIRGSSLF